MMKANVLEVFALLEDLCLSAINIHSVKVFIVLTAFSFDKSICLKKDPSK